MDQKHTPDPVALMHADWLEKSLTIGSLEASQEFRRLHAVEKQHDDLLAALKLLIPWVVAKTPKHFISMAHDAIAAVEQPAVAPVTDAGGWIEWEGGECHVAPACNVQVRFPDGDTEIRAAYLYRWKWEFDGNGGGDIIAYRIVKVVAA